jgi:hypothetical protein
MAVLTIAVLYIVAGQVYDWLAPTQSRQGLWDERKTITDFF